MALTVEDGTGLSDADSYIELTFADSYHSDRGNSAWADASESEREQALRKAVDYIDTAYRFRGIRLEEDQALEFPRDDLYDRAGRKVEGVPAAVKHAQAEAALVLLSQDLYSVAKRGGRIARVRVGPIEEQYEGGAAARPDPQKVTALLSGLTTGGASIPVRRS